MTIVTTGLKWDNFVLKLNEGADPLLRSYAIIILYVLQLSLQSVIYTSQINFSFIQDTLQLQYHCNLIIKILCNYNIITI